MAAPLAALPLELIARIAHFAALNDPIPTDLVSLMCTCRRVCDALYDNTHLLGQIFAAKFDTDAVRRRMGPSACTAHAFAAELRKRCNALYRVRRGIVAPTEAHLVCDLWTLYFIMLEDSGTNRRVLQSVDVRAWVMHVLHVLRDGRAVQATTLALWLLWLTYDKDTVQSETPTERNQQQSFLFNLIVTGFASPCVYAEEAYPALPAPRAFVPRIRPLPGRAGFEHYGQVLHVRSPLLAPAATLPYMARYEIEERTRADENRRELAHLPLDHAAALVRDWQGPTLEDVDALKDVHVRYPEQLDSRQHDADWARTVSCLERFAPTQPALVPVWQLGSLTGNWHGHVLVPSLDTFMPMLTHQTPPAAVRAQMYPWYVSLAEYHCIEPEQPLGSQVDAHAWLLDGYRVSADANAAWVYDPRTGRSTRYPRCPAVVGGKFRPGKHAKQDGDGVVKDVMVLGESDGPWGRYDIIGRVRAWDGLVALLRTPRHNADLGTWIFYGYLHGENLVGRWRNTTTPSAFVGLECAFVMTKAPGEGFEGRV